MLRGSKVRDTGVGDPAMEVMLGAIDLVCTQHRGEGGCPNACTVRKLM